MIIDHTYETAINVAHIAKSTDGSITQMRVWTDAAEKNDWKQFFLHDLFRR